MTALAAATRLLVIGVLGGGAWVRTPPDGDRAVVRHEELVRWLVSVRGFLPWPGG